MITKAETTFLDRINDTDDANQDYFIDYEGLINIFRHHTKEEIDEDDEVTDEVTDDVDEEYSIRSRITEGSDDDDDDMNNFDFDFNTETHPTYSF